MGKVVEIALVLCLASAGCDRWAGFGFRAEGPELARIREVLELGTGDVVADVGAGGGELSFALAKEVGPTGRVFSTEIDPARLQHLREAAAENELGNVTVIEAFSSETGLEADCCDAIVLRRVYHHLTDPKGINASLLRSLRAGGVLAVIDFSPPFSLGRGSLGAPADLVIAEVNNAGFALLRRIDDWPGRGPLGSYCMLFRKPEAR